MSLFSEFDLFRRSVHQLFSEFERDFLNDRYLLDTHFAEYPMLQQAAAGGGEMDIDNDQANNNNNKNNQGAMTATNATNNNATNNNNNASVQQQQQQQQLQARRGGNSVMNGRYPSLSSVFSSSLSPWTPLAVGFRSLPASCKMDVIEKNDRYEVHAELAGIPKENINIEIKDGLLTLTGEHRVEKEQKSLNENHQENKDNNNANNNNNSATTNNNGPVSQPQYHYRERSYSSVKRSIRLPDNIDQEKIAAKYDNGLLEIYLPKKEKQTPKTLNVQIA